MSEHRWDDQAECWVIDTPLGPRPDDPVTWRYEDQWQGWELTRPSLEGGPFHLRGYCLETGIPIGRTQSFPSIHAAKRAALQVGL